MNVALYAKRIHFADEDLTFFVHTYHDSEQLRAMLRRLRNLYPRARVIVCSDGDPNPCLESIAADANACFHRGDNLYALGNGGKVCQRLLSLFLEQPTDYLFKVDPDTGFHRRFAFLPAHCGMFGTLQSNPSLCSIQGGCCGFTREAAERMFHSNAFADPLLEDAPRSWASHPALWQCMVKVGRVSSDWMLGYVATSLGIPQFGFSEVASNWKRPVANPNLRYAVTHPYQYSDRW